MPAWFAAITQVPAVTPVTLVPLTVQTFVVVELKVTVNPEVAVALTVVLPFTDNVVGLNTIAPMVCGPVTVIFLVTCGATL